MPMKKHPAEEWTPVEKGWGLINPVTDESIDPPARVTEEKIVMTHWEKHDFAVQFIREHLEAHDHEVMSSQGNPEVDPSIWVVGKHKKPEWVVVRYVQYPVKKAKRPTNWNVIMNHASRLGDKGYFASVAFTSIDQQFEKDSPIVPPLQRKGGTCKF